MQNFLPEGSLINTEHNRFLTSSISALHTAFLNEEIIEGRVVLCDAAHNLIVKLGNFTGIVPHDEAALGISEGEVREIAVISRVGKPISVVVSEINTEGDEVEVKLSRRVAQERAREHFLNSLECGDVISATVTHLEPFGAFVDIGCGVVSLIGIENISVSRISHPRDRFYIGQKICAAVKEIDVLRGRISLTHRELLGTWQENADKFEAGQTVRGVVRGVEEYGIFVELAPNLSGLAEKRDDLSEGDCVSVFIKNIAEDKMKIKLIVIDKIDDEKRGEIEYFIRDGKIKHWCYSPDSCTKKKIYTDF